MITTNAYKGGRCFNANHKDAGVIVHIIPGIEPNGYWGVKSLCNQEPGKRSYGWVKTNKEVNCEKCLKKLKNKNHGN